MAPGAPRLSLVVVVHREQAYLGELAESVLAQTFGDFELIAVDDAAPGHAGALLDELAARDPRVRVLHQPERLGLGAARAAGLGAATGEHLWWMRPTDLLAPDALASVAACLDRTRADVVVVGHEHEDRLGRRRPGRHAELLARLAREGCAGPAAQQPGLAETGAAAWDKVVRRELADLSGAAGPAFALAPLLAAERVAALPNPLYVQRASGVGDRADDAPTAVADGYEAALAAATAAQRAWLLPAVARHELRILDRLPPARRAAFFTRASRTLRAHGGLPGAPIRIRLLERGSYGALRMFDRLRATRRVLRRLRRAVAARYRRHAGSRRRALEEHYRAQRRQPLDPDLAVFAAYWFRGYACNPRAIYERARELVPGMRGVWVVNRKFAADMPAGVECVVAGTREYFDVLARATYFVNNVNFPNHLVKRPGSVHVMTHHGTPLKTMGMDLRHAAIGGQRIDFAALLRRSERWDYSVSSNRLSTLVWERVYPTGHETLEVGYPRNDVLANATEDDVRRAREALGIGPGQVAVLYAPTHREWNPGYTPVVDIDAVAAALDEHHVVLARAHYFYDAGTPGGAGGVRDVAGHPSIEELCLAADVLVTDYSSLMFDYAVLDRPIVIHAPDWETYRTLRGTYFDLMAEPPGVVTTTEDELAAALRDGADGERARADRAAFRARYCALDDGRAAERVVRRVWLGERVSAPAAPVGTVAP